MTTIPLLRNLTKSDLQGKRVLLRLDLNIPVQNGATLDDYRMKRILPTLAFLEEKKSKVVVISHHTDRTQTLLPIVRSLQKYTPAVFVGDISNSAGIQDAWGEGKIAVCENLRFYGGEENNEEGFAKNLAVLGDIYVNEAFSDSHNSHASIVSIPKFLPSYLGLLFEEEIEKLSAAFTPPHPFLLILGGGKVNSKFRLIKKFLDIADTICVGGALSFNFFKAMGYEIGMSHYEDMGHEPSSLLNQKKIILPVDVRVSSSGQIVLKKPYEIKSEEKILDIGPMTLLSLKKYINEAKFILWNGPLGDYMVPGFGQGTLELISLLTESRAHVIAGGGDTVTLISQKGMRDKFDFVSTGGGAMLEFLAEETLPGIEALRHSKTGKR